jgi:pimeloyl-ACP methyl ester carboxylesterase
MTETSTKTGTRGYIDIGGHRTWLVDSGGSAEPVLMLHGGLSDSELLLDPLEPSLRDRYRVVAFDRRGHGRTADTAAAFHYEDMATQSIAVIEKVIGGPTHLVGWSDGAILALLITLRRPDLTRSLVLIGANYHFDGNMPISPGGSGLTILKQRYAERSPDGADHFSAVLKKSLAMFATEPTLTTDDLRTISARALVMVGDDDLMTLAHTASLYESLPHSQLAVIPGTSHAVLLEKPALMAEIVTDYLSAPAVTETYFPVRRKPRDGGG